MNGVKLIDKNTNELVDIDPSQVASAVRSGQFSFDKNRNYPVINNGTPKWVSSSDAAKYMSGLTFTTDDEVKTFNAEQKMGGVLPKLGAAAYGAGTALTLGALPLGIEMLGGEAGREFVETVERGAPKSVLAGEAIGSLVDPFALAGKVGQRVAAKGASQLAAREAAQAARAASPELALGEAALRAPAQAPAGLAAQVAGEAAQVGRGAIPAEVSPLVLGRQAAAPTAEEAAQLGFRSRARRTLAKAEPAPVEPMFPVAPGATSTAEPGLRLGADVYQTPELAMRARQAEELTSRAQAARSLEARAAEEAAGMERGLAPGQVGPVEDFSQMPSSTMESDYLRSEISRIDDALDANAAAARRARSQAARDSIGAERARLLEQRDRLDVEAMRTGMRSDEDLAAQAGRAFEASEAQAGAPARRVVSEQMGRLAGDIEAANTLPPTLRTAETRVAAENVSPRLGVPAMETSPNVSPMGLGMAETGIMPAARGLGLGEPMAATAGRAATSMGKPGFKLGDMAAGAAQTGAYGTLRTLGRQEAGLEEGGLPEALTVGALGAAMTPLLGVGGKAAGEAMGLGKRGFRDVIAKGASALEESGILRTFGISAAQAGKVQRLFYNPEAETLGTRELTNFAKEALANVNALKSLPENESNALLQSIRPEKGFGALSSDEKIAFTRAVNQSLNKTRDDIFARVGNPELSGQDISALMKHGVSKVGTAGKGITEITPFLREIEQLPADRPFSLQDLQRMKTAFGQQMEQAHSANPWRKEEIAFYNELKNLIQQKVGEASPELLTTLKAIDRASTMGIELEKGAAKLAAKLSVAQTVGPDTLAQVGLGAFAMKRVLDAIQFGVGAVALKAINLHRGDGIIADLSGNFAQKVATNPTSAAQEVTQSVLRSKSPQMTAMVAKSFVDVTPKSYSNISTLVRQLQDERDRVKSEMQSELASMPPAEAQAVAAALDAKINALAAARPKGLSTEKALTEQQKNYVIFARGVLDPSYAVQVMMNDGEGSEQAAKALQATPGGKEMLQALQQQFKAALDENVRLRDNASVVNIAKTLKKFGGKSIGTAALLHAPAPPAGGGPQTANAPRLGATAEKAATNALGSVYKTGTP